MIYFVIILLVAILLQYIELQFFRETSYEIKTEKIKDEVTICFLSDLHGKTYGNRLLRKIKKMSPDYILIGGDVVSKKKHKELEKMLPFVCELTKIAQVYYSFGNHETTLDTIITVEHPERRADWERYLIELQNSGVVIMRNKGITLEEGIYISALELPDMFFVKQEMVELSEEVLKDIYEPNDVDSANCFHVLLAHQPAYARVYETLHPDLILSGHTHGGLVRFPIIGSIISTELTFNPEFDGGRYQLSEHREMIVSKGLGTHTFHIRIFDRAEVIKLSIIPCKERQNLVE